MLSERKKKILKAVVDKNIESAGPVSSRDLKERYFEGISSATIRNDLMTLEEMGLLSQPHTSSGRIPTAEGYRLYAEELMKERELSQEEIIELNSHFNKKIDSIEELAKVVAETISNATNYASVAIMSDLYDAVIESVKLVLISNELCFVVVLTDMGIIKDLSITPPEGLTESDAQIVSRLLTDALGGCLVAELGDFKEDKISMVADRYRLVFSQVIESIVERANKKVLKIDGASNLLSQPDYSDLDKAKNAVKLFERQEVLEPLVDTGNELEISIKVGASESGDCSVVSANYKINGKSVGKAGVIGPVRMDYAKAVSVLKEVSKTISTSFENPINKNNKRLNKEKIDGRKRRIDCDRRKDKKTIT